MRDFTAIVEGHLDAVTGAILDPANPMWPSVVDAASGICPPDADPPSRVYRKIGAPRGSTLYWDQPAVVAACAVSALTGHPRHAEAAEAYIRAFLERCLRDDGMFRWGNHMYYDIFAETVVTFPECHELRPLTPAWNLFRRIAPEATVRYLRTATRRHVYDPGTGGFNRHDDARRDHAFLEAGGVLVETLAWLYRETGSADDLDLARRIAGYSFGHRDPSTGLVPNEPDHGRWDSRVCTSEVGLWAACLLRAADLTEQPAFVDMASQAVGAWLRHAWDTAAGRYAGQVEVKTGRQVMPLQPGYWPGVWADPWNTDQWPTHDYPVELAEACLELYERTAEEAFAEAVRRWTRIALATRPQGGRKAYAESYARCIRLLARAARRLDEPKLAAQARTLADDAVARLLENGLFKGHTGARGHQSVDGAGYLLLALLDLDTDGAVDLQGFRF